MFSFMEQKITKEDSLTILKSLRALMKLGNSLFESIKLQQEIEEKKNAGILRKVILLVEKKNKNIEDALLHYGIIGKSEYLILAHSNDAKESLDFILSIRDISHNFVKTVITLFMFPIASLFIGLGIAKWLLPAITKPVDELIKIAKVKKGVDIDNALNIPDAFFYIHHPEWVNYIFIVVVFFLIFIIWFFKKLEKENPSLIYKYFPLKAYDDIPYIFTLMRALNKGGMDLYSIAVLLQKSDIGIGWQKFFFRITKQIDSNKDLYKVFQQFRFPKQIFIIVKTSEKSGSFWDSFDSMIEYTKDVNKIKNAEIVGRYANLTKMLGYGIIVFFLLGILLLMFGMQNIVMAIQ